MKEDKEQYVIGICESIERSRKQNKTRDVYEGIRKITGKRAQKISVVKDTNGNVISDIGKVKERWQEYFEGLYNDPNPVDEDNLAQLPDCSDPDETPGILMEEVQRAITRLKKSKTPGIDSITAEEIRAATEERGPIITHQLCQRIWDEERGVEESRYCTNL